MGKKMASGTIRFGNGDQLQERGYNMEEVRDAIAELDGVLKVETNQVTRMFYVEYDPEKISFETLRKEVKSYTK